MNRQVIEQITAKHASDGDGVKLLRVFGGARPERFDPFLLMDEFGSDEASDYIGGFPPHPHRGFQTMTYMLQGKMEHKDHMGNVGLLGDTDVQWMSAGKGVIHSEMPKQTEGKMRGFQVWLNLPAKDKMQPAAYQDIAGSDIPHYAIDGITVKAIAGHATINHHDTQGYFTIADTHAVYLDLHIAAGKTAMIELANDTAGGEEMNTLLYNYDGEIHIGDKNTPAKAQTLSRLSGQGKIVITAVNNQAARVILLAGKPINEPIVQHGPFVMNTAEEISQAISDYQDGTLVA